MFGGSVSLLNIPTFPPHNMFKAIKGMQYHLPTPKLSTRQYLGFQLHSSCNTSIHYTLDYSWTLNKFQMKVNSELQSCLAEIGYSDYKSYFCFKLVICQPWVDRHFLYLHTTEWVSECEFIIDALSQ